MHGNRDDVDSGARWRSRPRRRAPAALIAFVLLGLGCDSEAETALAPTLNLPSPRGSVGSASKPAPDIEPAAWTRDVGSKPRCGIAKPRDGSVLSASIWRRASVKIVTPGWRGRKQHDLIRLVLDDFPAVTLSRDDTTASLGDLSGGAESLEEGLHTVFAYPVGEEGRHPKGAMVGVARFWIGAPARKLPPLQQARYVRLGSPTGSWVVSGDKPALLDVVLFGTDLTEDRLKLRVSLRGPGGEASRVVSKWTPLALSGLAPGRYQLEAALVTAQGHAGVAHHVELIAEP